MIKIYLNTGIYTFSITIECIETKYIYLWVQNLGKFRIQNPYTLSSPVLINGILKW